MKILEEACTCDNCSLEESAMTNINVCTECLYKLDREMRKEGK
jgi:hypothetical protein